MQRLMDTKSIQSRLELVESPADELAVYDVAAVNENYEGRLAQHQIHQLRLKMRKDAIWIVSSYLVTLFLALSAWNNSSLLRSLMAMILLFAVCTVVCWPWLQNLYTVRRDVNHNTVMHTDGLVTKSSKLFRAQGRNSYGQYYVYTLEINGSKFNVPQEIYVMCKKDVRYRLYYAALSHEVVNLHSL